MLTEQELNHGVAHWRTTFWPRDFHNRFYAELAEINDGGQFTIEWWNRILPHLNCWRATRPKSAAELTERAVARMENLRDSFHEIADAPNDIAANRLTWETVERFTLIATEIKGAHTPVFRSKLCHFVSPKRFPVVDSGALGLSGWTYQRYWNFVKEEWTATPNERRRTLVHRLREEAGANLRPDFPYACKITEICLIGRNHPVGRGG